MKFGSVGVDPQEIDEINNLIHAVEERLKSLRRAREVLDEFTMQAPIARSKRKFGIYRTSIVCSLSDGTSSPASLTNRE
jgi:hypothetical protein